MGPVDIESEEQVIQKGVIIMGDSFKLKLLLSCLRIICRYFEGDEQACGLSIEYYREADDVEDFECHIACNCDGDINQCDLPEKFRRCL